MRITFIVIYLGFIVSARKHRPIVFSSSSDESHEADLPFADGVLDLRGSVRREFALEVALEDHGRNMICSPMSVLMPLGKLAMGAGRRTRNELLNALGLSRKKYLKPAFAQLITSLEYLPGVTLDIASRIYVSSKNQINKKFEKNTELIFKSSCQKINSREPKKTAKTINRWVASSTKNKIKNLIYPGDIAEDTSLILVNAIYFSGNWLNKFDGTFTDDFFSPSGRQRVTMMTRNGKYNYWKCDTLNAQIIEIPYEGLQSAMIIVLPYSTSGLGVLLRALKIAPDLLNKALQRMKITDIMLSMPKFKIESEIDLVPLLTKMGLRAMFDYEHSDLNKIIEDETVFVSKAIHKAVIEVNEIGTEASAATAFGIVTSAMLPKQNIRFDANRPFYFIIKAYQDQLFAGIFNAFVGLGSALETHQKRLEFVANRPFYFIIKAYQDQLFAGIFNGK